MKCICLKCLKSSTQKKHYTKLLKSGLCSACNKHRDDLIYIKKILDKIENAFKFEYEVHDDWHKDMYGVDFSITLQQGLKLLTKANANVCNSLSRAIIKNHANNTESFFNKNNSYYIKDPRSGHEDWSDKWDILCKSLTEKSRFFNKEAENLLDTLFEDIDKMKTINNNSLFKIITTNQVIYRARYVKTHQEFVETYLRPDIFLSAPPINIAANGRMNSKGIRAFYGATKIETAINEVRPSINGKVIVGEFRVLKPLRILNMRLFKNLSDNVNILTPDYINQKSKYRFLKRMMDLMTKPTLDVNNFMDYIPTQAVADYLSNKLKHNINGLAYISTQGNGTNVMLFENSLHTKQKHYKMRTWATVGEISFEPDEELRLLVNQTTNEKIGKTYKTKIQIEPNDEDPQDAYLEVENVFAFNIKKVRYTSKQIGIH